MNRQEIFDKVAVHLLTQKKKAKNGTECVYRTLDGSKCALGALIPDELYTPKIEGITMYTAKLRRGSQKDWGDSALGPILDKILPGWDNDSDLGIYNLLYRLQSLHDHVDVESWKVELTQLAENFYLSAAAINNL